MLERIFRWIRSIALWLEACRMVVIVAGIIDWLIGDPQSPFHPVACIGYIIAKVEKYVYPLQRSPKEQIVLGGFGTLLVLLIIGNIIMWGEVLLYHGLPLYVRYLVEAFILSFTICPRSLAKAARDVQMALQYRHLQRARYYVSHIVGRDTKQLTAGEIVRATVETVAENTIDGIISPLFFYLLFGIPGAVLYRTVNTLDSMWGYKNERFLYFGRVAARLDDIGNYIPARITFFLLVVVSWVVHLDSKGAWCMGWRDANKHPSPNGGWAEATVAGALHVQLGGYNSYFGKVSFRAYMGDASEMLAPKHITKAIQLMYGSTGIMIAVVALFRIF